MYTCSDSVQGQSVHCCLGTGSFGEDMTMSFLRYRNWRGKPPIAFEFCSNFTFGRENDRCVSFLDVNFIERIGEILEQTLGNLLRVLTSDIVEVTRCLSRRWDIFFSFILACWTCLISAKKSQSFAKTEAGLWNWSRSSWKYCWTTGPWYLGVTTLIIAWVAPSVFWLVD